MSNVAQMQQVSEEFQHMVEDFFLVQSRYSAAIREIQTKLEILDDEFQMRHQRNPIHHMQSRLKSIQSITCRTSPASASSALMCRMCTPLLTCSSARMT